MERDCKNFIRCGNKVQGKSIRCETCKRKRANASARNRNDLMRSLGLKKTPYGWE